MIAPGGVRRDPHWSPSTGTQPGVHATIAGVALGLLTATGDVGGRNVPERLEHRLHPLSAFVIVPLFVADGRRSADGSRREVAPFAPGVSHSCSYR